MENESYTFETGLAELESLVHALERGDMKLDESFEAFERAKALEKKLRGMLSEGDRRIHALTEEGEEIFEGDPEA